MKFSGKVGNGPVNKLLHYHCCKLDLDPDPDTGKMCLGGGMHSPNASRCYICQSLMLQQTLLSRWCLLLSYKLQVKKP